MRGALALFLAIVIASSAVFAADSAAEWLDRAANPTLTLREREYAARQVLMLAEPSASILISALRGEGSDSGLRRQVAAGLLGELAVPVAEAPLLEAAFGKDYFLSEAASAALARIYSRLSDGELYALLKKGGRDRNAVPGGLPAGEEDWLVLSLGAAENRGKFRAIVMRGLTLKYADRTEKMPAPLADCVWDTILDPDRELRMYSAIAAAKTSSSLAPEKLAAFLYAESDSKLLVAALRSMREMRPPDFGEAVERQTANADPMVALEALATLDAMGYPGVMFPAAQGARAVATFVTHPSTPVRLRAIELLAESKSPAALDFLMTALFDRVGANRAAAAAALGELGFPGAVGGLSPLLRDGRPEVRTEAAVALARLGAVGVAAGQLDQLEAESPPFRRAAAQALGRIGDARAIPALVKALSDADSELACLSAEALGRIGKKEAGPGLYAVMTSTQNPVLADTARKALTDIYLDDPGASKSSWESWALRNPLRGRP